MVTMTKEANGDIRVHVDCVLKGGSARRIFMVRKADGGLEGLENTPFIEALANSFAWNAMLENGEFSDKSALARHMGFDRSGIRPILRLSYLSPVIVEKAMRGELNNPSITRLGNLRTPLWYDQHKALGID